MAWKIKNIEIANFKFFNSKFTLKLNGANLLVFGENGAGKSSLYWSIYTHFQAVTKDSSEAAKYFTAGHKENLRNRYCSYSAPSGIWIEFDNGKGLTKTIEDSSIQQYIDEEDASKFMSQSIITSDFLNYKIISRLFDFNNSQDNEIFDILKKEVFHILPLDEQLINVQKVPTGKMMVEDWWNYICKFQSILPRNKKTPNTFNQGSEEYKEFLKILNKFDNLFRALLFKIFLQTNDIIQDKFKIPVKLGFDYEPVHFNENVGESKRKKMVK